MLRQVAIFLGLAIAGSDAQANDWDAAAAEYNKSYLQVEDCFAREPIDREACVVAGIHKCVRDLEGVLETKGLPIPGGAAVSPHEYCNYIGLDRADEHLNAVYQRILKQGPERPHDKEAVANLRAAQRLWLQFANAMCSGENIVGWHAGGSGWGAITAECTTRLSIQQAANLEDYFTIEN
ncbi:lysozyme inhibitor LprI family protein [Thioclava sp. JE_KL1]|uniref:lysozyme inhibitor LprI family protein n=1 Tax=Thioclava sp. JE_KL1 TaxID=2651187 RepID=UPI001561F419|nr:lysozyme inhibitor LprI family protein [Thioclava sp. JE_KL1]